MLIDLGKTELFYIVIATSRGEGWLVEFYGISTFIGHLNSVYIYIYIYIYVNNLRFLNKYFWR